ncbi:YggS family pyridoxal phosphate-dependent enzyme [Arthrobacter crusticola]|uniref:Pyridoxal phosphate homeostasis protein n=1 Tax=Arthrobacter crusticola TaxID=2547960 RepID=A0A4R5TSS3_9MICC|nr:YggS family pyridoxal phosphate-dependent enzyme [Arthrobacter crusticola]
MAHVSGTDGAADAGARRQELAVRLGAVRARISAACAAAGRTDAPGLIVVTKFFPAADVRLLSGLGVRDVGENRDQEAAAKAAETADLDLRWHFIGQLQSNKARSVLRYAAAVHSVDRPSVAEALAKAAGTEAERRSGAGLPQRSALLCFIQVSLDPDARAGGRGGAAPSEVPEIAARLAGVQGLHLEGVMAVAPLGADPLPAFQRLAGISADLRADHPGASAISAGMSGDLEAAIQAGATHLRVGSDVLGPRPPVR